jgi:serine/threonine-protein kinase
MSFKAGLTLGTMIGQGHFGDVYEGHDHLHGKVAAKVLHQMPGESLTKWQARKDDLMDEAHHLKAAEHPNIVRVLNLVRHDVDDNLHMVTEFCDGGSVLTEYIAGPMCLDRVRRIINDVCLGLDSIHAKGMLHRDIKPGNILLSNNIWKLADFGLVTDDILNGYASGAGYADHVAYEVWNHGVTSVRSDIWALGMTVYRLIHGHPFYSEQFAGRTIPDDVQQGGFAHTLVWLQHLPKAWQSFVRRAMNDNRDQRFQNVHQFSQALGQLPIAPVWECTYTPTKTIWTRVKGGRRWEVIWEAHSPRTHTWSAVSRGGKRDMTLGGSTGQIGRMQLDSQLRDFFQQAS